MEEMQTRLEKLSEIIDLGSICLPELLIPESTIVTNLLKRIGLCYVRCTSTTYIDVKDIPEYTFQYAQLISSRIYALRKSYDDVRVEFLFKDEAGRKIRSLRDCLFTYEELKSVEDHKKSAAKLKKQVSELNDLVRKLEESLGK